MLVPRRLRARAVADRVSVTLADGGTAVLRPLSDGESGPLLEVFSGMSLESRALRYLVPMPRLPGALRRNLTRLDGTDRVAWLASVDGRAAGIVRYTRLDDELPTAEIAFEIVDDHQGRGLGTALLDTITTVACFNGIRRLHAAVLPENLPSRRLLSRLDMALTLDDGILEGTAPLRLLDPARVDRAAVVRLARADARRGEAATAADGVVAPTRSRPAFP
ncbi:MAG TPA: GNAT family N-acetyltransferase [Nocardioidaceae bacterium]|jgi:GNAT superfamily N-acetyltransferase